MADECESVGKKGETSDNDFAKLDLATVYYFTTCGFYTNNAHHDYNL